MVIEKLDNDELESVDTLLAYSRQIGVESSHGNGSTFWFSIPLNPDAALTSGGAPEQAAGAVSTQ